MKVPAMVKLAGLVLFSIAVLIAGDWWLAGLAAILVAAALLLRADARKIVRMFRPALPVIVALSLLQWLFSGPSAAALICARIVLIYLGGAVMTATTTEGEFADAIERLLWPVSALTRTNAGRDVATMMTLAIAFIPIIKEEHDAIRLAQEARGVSYAGIPGVFRGEIAVIVPLIYALSVRADRIAEAMEARCYGYKKL